MLNEGVQLAGGNGRLLDNGASPDATCRPSRVSAIHIAALHGDSSTLRELIRNGARCSARDRFGRQAVHYAAWAGQVETLQFLIRADPSLVNSPVKPNPEPEHEMDLDWGDHQHKPLDNLIHGDAVLASTPLHLACKTLSFEAVDLLLKNGAKATIKDAKGLTPLDVTGLNAASSKQTKRDGKTVTRSKNLPNKQKYLKPSSHDYTKKDSDSDENENDDDKTEDEPKPAQRIVTALLVNGATMPKGNVMLEEGLEINQIKMDVTVLHTAVANNDPELVEYLLNKGACITIWNVKEETPLHLAVKKSQIESLKKIIHNLSSSSVVDVRDGQGWTPLHHAVMSKWQIGVDLLLDAGADAAAISKNKESVVHMAAEKGNKTMLENLLSIPKCVEILDRQDLHNYTPLFRAVESKNLSCVKLLCEYGADSTTTTAEGITLLHVAALNNSIDILGYLLSRNAITVINNCTKNEVIYQKKNIGGLTALHIAAKNNNKQCVNLLLKHKCKVTIKLNDGTALHLNDRGGTALHLAAEKGYVDVVEAIVLNDIKTLKMENLKGWQPLHIAAGFGRSECVTYMINKGADLSAKVKWEDDKEDKTALDLIMYCIPEPVKFLENFFDSRMKLNGHPLNNPECTVKLLYNVLSPGDQSGKLEVLKAILDNGNQTLREQLLLHPLTETYVYFKWEKLKYIFAAIFTLYVILTLSLTSMAYAAHVEKDPSTVTSICTEKAKFGFYPSLILIFLMEFINLLLLRCKYIKDLESWLKWSVIVTSSVVGFTDQPLPWSRNIASIAVLLSWIELLFLLARYPNWGYYVLMFTTVATKVFKVLTSFIFLLLGFTFAFLIYFDATQPFRNIGEALIKVLVMMLELDYGSRSLELDIFSFIGRLIFIAYVILVAVVMVNLMIGLAVSDIALLEKQGKTQRLAKQIEFLSLLDLTLYNVRFLKIIPKGLQEKLQEFRAVRTYIMIKPTRPMDKSLVDIPKYMKESILNRICSSQNNIENFDLNKNDKDNKSDESDKRTNKYDVEERKKTNKPGVNGQMTC